MGFKKGHAYHPPKGGAPAGRKKSPASRLKDALIAAESHLPAILQALNDIALGKPIVCPGCGHHLKQTKADVNACIYLVNKLTGLPVARHELSLAQQIELSADDCSYLDNVARQTVMDAQAIPEGIEGEWKEKIDEAMKPQVHPPCSIPTQPDGEVLLLGEGETPH